MAEKVRDKTRLCNTHFYMPPEVNGLDLMSDGETDRALLDTLLTVLPEFGVYPFEARKECTGFIFNRVWAAIKRESLSVVAEGVARPEDVDGMYKLNLGAPAGPFQLMDLVGLDVALDIENHYLDEFPQLPKGPRDLLQSYVDAGKLGIKTGEGFYTIPADQRSMVPPSTLTTWPLIQAPSDDNRNATSAATSSGSPTRVGAHAFQCGGLQLRPLWHRPDGLSRGEPGCYCVTTDSVLAPPGRDVSGERADPRFRGGVRGSRSFALKRRGRRHVDDRTAAATQHCRDGVLHRRQVAPQADCHDPVPHLEIDVDDVGVGAQRPHVGPDVEQQVDSAVHRCGVVNQPGHRLGVRQVEMNLVRRAACSDDARRRLHGGIIGDVADDYPAAFLAEPGRGRRTDASSAADYDDNLVGQTPQSHACEPSNAAPGG